jgi:protein-S-isoprenylcysteine O-methyltransferase Ste14
LQSYAGWLAAILVSPAPFLIWRIVDEEAFLAKNLTGYSAYRREVHYRLVPGMW